MKFRALFLKISARIALLIAPLVMTVPEVTRVAGIKVAGEKRFSGYG